MGEGALAGRADALNNRRRTAPHRICRRERACPSVDFSPASTAIIVIAAVFIATTATLAFAHEAELLVGRSAAGQIKIVADLHHPIGLAPSIFPGIPGYAFGEPAFHATILDDAPNDFFQLAPTANFQFLVTAADPGISIYTPTGPLALNTPVDLGPSVFDYHPIWHIPAGPVGANYNISVKIHDTTGTYTDSAPLVIPFTAIPEPHTLAVLALAPLALSATPPPSPTHFLINKSAATG